MNIVALQAQRINGKVVIEDSRGEKVLSIDPVEVLSLIVEPYENCYKVAWDVLELVKPILTLLPADIIKKLKKGERAEYKGFRLWLGATRHGYVFGVSYKERTHLRGNIYSQKVYDADIFELKQYYSDEPAPEGIRAVVDKGIYLTSVLERMGLNPRRLTSAAAIYKECVLDKMPIPTIWNMPENSFPMMEMAANYVREWHGDFKSGNWEAKSLYRYDLSAAYPSALASLPNLTYADYVPYGEQRKATYWGILQGKLEVDALISPLVDERGRNLVGEFENAVITTDDLQCLDRWKLGTFKPASGWYITLKKDVKLFDYIMRRLYDYRGGNPTRDALAKAMSVSVWGKFLEMHGEDFGDYFNGIYACMVTSKVRARVCDFIYENELQKDVAEVTVDGVRAKKILPITDQRHFGEWRIVQTEGKAK